MLKINDPFIQEILKLSQDTGGTDLIDDANVQEILIDITKDEENSSPIIKSLISGKTTDEEIAEETEIRLNIVRRVLYKLYDAGMASYKRSKDPETQWYTYSWKFEEDKIKEVLEERSRKFSKELDEFLEYGEDNMFFTCSRNGCSFNLSEGSLESLSLIDHLKKCSYSFEEAAELNFTCPHCGGTMEYQDNSSLITQLKEIKEKIS